MLKIDSHAGQVLIETKGNLSDLEKYYIGRFKTLFKQETKNRGIAGT